MPEPNSAPTKRVPIPPVIAEPEFSAREIERLMELRTRYDRGDYHELSQEHKRLLFARWLVEHGRLGG